MRCSRKCAVPSGTICQPPLNGSCVSHDPTLNPEKREFPGEALPGTTRRRRPFGSVSDNGALRARDSRSNSCFLQRIDRIAALAQRRICPLLPNGTNCSAASSAGLCECPKLRGPYKFISLPGCHQQPQIGLRSAPRLISSVCLRENAFGQFSQAPTQNFLLNGGQVCTAASGGCGKRLLSARPAVIHSASRACVRRSHPTPPAPRRPQAAFAPAHAAKHLPFTVSTLVVRTLCMAFLQILPSLLHKLRQKRAGAFSICGQKSSSDTKSRSCKNCLSPRADLPGNLQIIP